MQFLTLDHAARQRDLAVAQAEFDAAEETQLVFLAPHRQLFARRIVVEHVLPVDALEHRLDLGRVVARRVEAADDRAHRGAGDALDRHMLAFEHLEHADMRRAARAAAAEDEASFRMRCRRLRKCVERDAAGGGEQKAGKSAKHGTIHSGGNGLKD